ncbi:hypothetical protein GQ54DRAFT_341598 [Martensiomyces pterosporus]|nr:hypothetical protein GQ54DRAFT_341598 [Martensiomyces pterosporus]
MQGHMMCSDTSESSAQAAKRRRLEKGKMPALPSALDSPSVLGPPSPPGPPGMRDEAAPRAEPPLPLGFPQPPVGYNDLFYAWACKWRETRGDVEASGDLRVALADLCDMVSIALSRATQEYEAALKLRNLAQERCNLVQERIILLESQHKKLRDFKISMDIDRILNPKSKSKVTEEHPADGQNAMKEVLDNVLVEIASEQANLKKAQVDLDTAQDRLDKAQPHVDVAQTRVEAAKEKIRLLVGCAPSADAVGVAPAAPTPATALATAQSSAAAAAAAALGWASKSPGAASSGDGAYAPADNLQRRDLRRGYEVPGERHSRPCAATKRGGCAHGS